LSFIWNN